MATYRCPRCHEEAVLEPRDGYEIVAVYCLRHKAGLSGRTDPIRMEPAVASPAREPVPAAAS